MKNQTIPWMAWECIQLIIFCQLFLYKQTFIWRYCYFYCLFSINCTLKTLRVRRNLGRKESGASSRPTSHSTLPWCPVSSRRMIWLVQKGVISPVSWCPVPRPVFLRQLSPSVSVSDCRWDGRMMRRKMWWKVEEAYLLHIIIIYLTAFSFVLVFFPLSGHETPNMTQHLIFHLSKWIMGSANLTLFLWNVNECNFESCLHLYDWVWWW